MLHALHKGTGGSPPDMSQGQLTTEASGGQGDGAGFLDWAIDQARGYLGRRQPGAEKTWRDSWDSRGQEP